MLIAMRMKTKCASRATRYNRAMNLLRTIFVWCLLAANGVAATYYIDFNTGADTNPGTKAAPWKRNPHMQGWAGTYNPQGGDRFIFKGGVVWPSSTLPLKPTASGAANNPTYFGVEQDWYAGAAWSRPILDAEYIGETCIDLGSLSWLVFEGFEIKRVISAKNFGFGLIQGGTPTNVLLKGCYLHGWRTTNSADDAHGGVIMMGYAAGVDTLVMEDCEIENSENQARWGGVAVRMWGVIRKCRIHHNSSAVLFCLDFDGNDLYNICHPVGGFDAAYHWNGVYLDAKTLGKNIGYCRNSRIRDCGLGANMAYLNPRGAKIYCYNNVFWGEISDQRAVEVEPYNYNSGGTDGEAYIYNNTGFIEANSPLIRVVDRGSNPKLAVLVAQNNHVIGTNASVQSANPSSIGSMTIANNLVQTPDIALSQGYSSTNQWAPTDAGDATVDRGVSIAGVFTTDINGFSRDATWDIGAYEFSIQGNVAPAVAPVVQNAQDVDPAAPGLQVYVGTDVQYSSSATDANGDPLSWNWSYSLNGGNSVVVANGTGPVQPTLFSYAGATAGSNYVWKLTVSDGQATSSSQLQVSVVAPPPPEQGFTFEAEAGVITGPFQVQNGILQQASQTILSQGGQPGRAVYRFTTVVEGDYVISGLVNAPSDSNNSFYFNIDAEPTDPASVWQIPVTNNFEERLANWQGAGTWDNPQFVPKRFRLVAGDHTLIILGREPGTQLDRVRILKLPVSPQGVRISNP